MNIIETKIPDVTMENIETSKKILAENVIENVYPLFDNIYSEKLSTIQGLKIQLKSKKNDLKTQKESIENLMGEYARKKKISKLLYRIEQLVNSGLIYDGTLKHETVILLKIIEKLPPDKLDQQLAKTVQIISKRFSK